jgi:MerR family transcriptional regulator, copper efflux regulator
MTDKNKSYLLSGELARQSGVSPDTIRFYERKGLLRTPERSAGSYRKYPAESLMRVRLIRSALAVGFTIGELSEILRVRDNGGKPCHRVQQIALQKLQEIEMTIHELKRIKGDLQSCIKDWEQALLAVPEKEPALLLEQLAKVHQTSGGQNSPMIPAGLRKKRRRS